MQSGPLYIVPLLCYTPATVHPTVPSALKASTHGHAIYASYIPSHLASPVWRVRAGRGDAGMDRWNRAAFRGAAIALATLGLAARRRSCLNYAVRPRPEAISAWR